MFIYVTHCAVVCSLALVFACRCVGLFDCRCVGWLVVCLLVVCLSMRGLSLACVRVCVFDCVFDRCVCRVCLCVGWSVVCLMGVLTARLPACLFLY